MKDETWVPLMTSGPAAARRWPWGVLCRRAPAFAFRGRPGETTTRPVSPLGESGSRPSPSMGLDDLAALGDLHLAGGEEPACRAGAAVPSGLDQGSFSTGWRAAVGPGPGDAPCGLGRADRGAAGTGVEEREDRGLEVCVDARYAAAAARVAAVSSARPPVPRHTSRATRCGARRPRSVFSGGAAVVACSRWRPHGRRRGRPSCATPARFVGYGAEPSRDDAAAPRRSAGWTNGGAPRGLREEHRRSCPLGLHRPRASRRHASMRLTAKPL